MSTQVSTKNLNIKIEKSNNNTVSSTHIRKKKPKYFKFCDCHIKCHYDDLDLKCSHDCK